MTSPPLYIVVGQDLTIKVTSSIVDNGISIPAIRSNGRSYGKADLVYVNGKKVLFPSEMLRHQIGDLLSQDVLRDTGKRVAFSIAPPDPWLYAILWLMWEGIVQGASWDAIKLALKSGLSSLQQQKLAPTQQSTESSKFFELFIELPYLFRLYVQIKKNFRSTVPGEGSLTIPSIEHPPLEDDPFWRMASQIADAESIPKGVKTKRTKKSAASSRKKAVRKKAAPKRKSPAKKLAKKKTPLKKKE